MRDPGRVLPLCLAFLLIAVSCFKNDPTDVHDGQAQPADARVALPDDFDVGDVAVVPGNVRIDLPTPTGWEVNSCLAASSANLPGGTFMLPFTLTRCTA